VPPHVREPPDCGWREREAITSYLGHASIQTTFDLYGHLMPGNETRLWHLLTPTSSVQIPLPAPLSSTETRAAVSSAAG
jgi:hypothetical protein